MNESRLEHCRDCDSCEKVSLETAREHICGDCDYNFHKDRAHTFERQKDYWKQRDKDNGQKLYRQENEIEFLKTEIARKNKQLDFLR